MKKTIIYQITDSNLALKHEDGHAYCQLVNEEGEAIYTFMRDQIKDLYRAIEEINDRMPEEDEQGRG